AARPSSRRLDRPAAALPASEALAPVWQSVADAADQGDPMRVLLVLLIAAAGFAPGAAGVAAQTGTPAASEIARTNLRYFLPFSEDGLASSLTVTKNVKGECLLPSLADVGRPDAWMCSDPATDEIFDPCFENPFTPIDEPGELAC